MCKAFLSEANPDTWQACSLLRVSRTCPKRKTLTLAIMTMIMTRITIVVGRTAVAGISILVYLPLSLLYLSHYTGVATMALRWLFFFTVIAFVYYCHKTLVALLVC